MDNLEFRMVGYQPPSTNDMYVPTSGAMKTSKSGRRYCRAFLRKSDWLNEWQNKMKEMFDSEFFYTKEELKEFSSEVLDNNLGLKMDIIVSMPISAYGKRTLRTNDASNYIKAIEDCISTGIGVDDKYNLVVSARKYYNRGTEWSIIVRVSKLSNAWSIDNELNEEDGFYEFNK